METEQPTGQTGQPADAPRDDRADAAPQGPQDPAAQLGRIERHLERIVEHMYQVQREQQTREFGLLDIFAALAQVLAIAALLGAVLALLKTRPDQNLAVISLLGAIAFQGLALTLFVLKKT